jgi:Protein of unknown function (DUF726)
LQPEAFAVKHACCCDDVENIDVTQIVGGHLGYRESLEDLLRYIGLDVPAGATV